MKFMKKVVIDGIRYELNRKNRTATVLPLEYGQYSGDINIPSTIVHKRFLFKDITYSVVAIGMHAFGHCPNVTSITIPKSVNSIELAAFYACSSMKTLTLPNHVVFESTFFGSTYFQDCNSLQLINLTADSIEEFCAGSCNLELCSLLDWHEKGVRRKIIINNSEITKVILPDYLTIIKDGTFAYCHSLVEIIVPNNVTNIGYGAFAHCHSLVEIIVPDKVTNIGCGAFVHCSALQSITIPQNVTTLGEGAFYGCSQLTQIIIPNSIKTIEKDIFAECTSLKKIILTAKSIEEYIQNNINHLLYNAKCHYIGRELVINDVVQTDIVIPSTISTLGDNLFYYCQSISTLTLSNTTTLGEDCLHGCTSLKTIKLEVGSIEEYCKNGRINLNLSRTLTDNIEYKLLINGQEVTEITIPDGIYNRGGTHIFPFKNCSSITSIVLPTSLSDLPGGLSRIGGFHGCSSLKTLIIPKGFQKINSDAFKGCSSLESIVIPNTITGILLDSFSGCSSLKNIELPENLEFIGDYAFENCTSLVSITIPKNVKTIGKNAFKGCTALTSIHWNAKECADTQQLRITTDWRGNRLECRFVDSPFADIASQITTFTFGTDVECIPARLCYNMTQLKSIFIPYNVKSIGNGFCHHILDKLIISHHIVSKQEITDFVYRAEDTDIIVDDIEAYCLKPMLPKIKKSITGKNEIPATDYTNRRLIVDGKEILDIIIPNTIDAILDNTFKHFVNIKSVVIPQSVTSIGNYAFYRCISLPSITIPSSVKHIGNYAFASCSSLESIIIPTNITSLSNGTFKDCSSLKSISLPDGLEQIGAQTFAGCSSLTSINISNSVMNIGEDAFKECSSLTSIMIPNGVTSIEHGVFSGCKSLTSVVIPDSVISIGEYVFYSCSSLCSVVLPENITSIGKWSFSNCSSLALITLKASSIESFCESNINNLLCSAQCLTKRHLLINDMDSTELIVPDSVTILNDYAFYGCSNLVTITLPETLSQIGEHTFDDCESLQSIRVPMNKKEEFCKLGLEPYREYIEEIEEIVPEELQQEVNILLNIAKGYELGIGMAKNLAQAVLIYSQAAEKGCAEAAYHLGELYEKGEGLPQDYQCAIDWYTKAVSLYHPSAEERKKHCEQILQKEMYVAECQFDIQKSKQTAKYIFFDTECNGLPFSNKLSVDDTSNWPRMIQLAWLVTDEHGNILKRQSHIIYPQGFIITDEVEGLTGITTSRAKSEGVNLRTVLNEFMDDLVDAELVIGHNIDFDKHVLGCELYRERLDYDTLLNKKSVCTMQRSTNFCAIPNPNSYYGGYKWPKLEELYQKLFNTTLSNAHDALSDVEATRKCYFELKKQGIF